MSESKTKRPLYLQTIESLFAELISGSAVSVSEEEEFELPGKDSRAILNWYRQNRGRWAGNIMAQHVDDLVNSMANEPPSLAVPQANIPNGALRLRLVRVVAHRFAGLHGYGDPSNAPIDFVFEPAKPITLFEGWNGAGKTSLLNAVVWCLTGQILRPQRPPESAESEFDSYFLHDDDGGEQTGQHAVSPVTPIPDPNVYVPPLNHPIPADTWVELTFCDQDGTTLQPIRRTQMRKANGKLSELAPDLSELGVDPISMRIGTVMPAMLTYLRVGEASDLGLAAAKLTGLADLSHLSRHALRVRVKLAGDLKDARESEIELADKYFLEASSDLQKQVDEFPQMSPGKPLPIPSADAGLEKELEELEQHFTKAKSDALKAAQTILGSSFDPSQKSARDELEQTIGPAQGQLKTLALLPAARRFKSLSDVTDLEWQAVEESIEQIYTEADILAELAAQPDLSRRKQLYARVSSWMGEGAIHDLDSCAVCNGALEGALDPVTKRAVVEHLKEIAEEDTEVLSLTQASWARQRLAALTAKCPANLRPELTRDLPDHPKSLITALFVDDLFHTEAFSGVLSPLRIGIQTLCERVQTDAPDFVEPVIAAFPDVLYSTAADLSLQIKRLRRARAFAEWRSSYDQPIADLFKRIMRGTNATAGDPSKQSPITTLTPIGPKLDALNGIVKGVAPINSALELIERMNTQLKARRSRETRLALYEKASVALEALVKLGELAEKQVEGLRSQLHDRASYWRGECYANAYVTAGHALRDTAMDVRGVLDIRVGSSKASAPAQHVSNASALRASLFGFYLAFWEHVLNERGGIQLLVLDDPQDLLDADNRHRLARTLTSLCHAGAQILVTTYDRFFAQAIANAGKDKATVEHRSVHPVNATRLTLATALAVEQLDAKRQAFEEDQDDASRAQDFASETRIFLEARLRDLFDDPAYPAYSAPSKSPTLSDHINRLRGLAKAPPNALFKGKSVQSFIAHPGLAVGSDMLRVLNTAHHAKATLSAGEVAAVAADLEQVRKLAEKVHLEFRHWRWQEPLKDNVAPPQLPDFTELIPPQFSGPVYPDLAAFTGSVACDASQDTATDTVDSACLAGKALFYVRTSNLGFAANAGSIAIVESTSYEGKDHNLVIARQKSNILARRLVRGQRHDSLGLISEPPDPREAKPTLFFSPSEIALHRIVGVLFEGGPPPLGSGEAIQIEDVSSLQHIQCAYRVTEDSAVPLALPGQLVLGGTPIAATQLDAHIGELAAVTLRDGKSVFKRIGPKVTGAVVPVRQYESIGGLGASLLVADEDIENMPDAPTFAFARRIVGVLYYA